MSLIPDNWRERLSDAAHDIARGGLPAVLDMPTEGRTPSNVGGPSAPRGTERTAPQSEASLLGGQVAGVPMWAIGAGVAVLVGVLLVVRK